MSRTLLLSVALLCGAGAASAGAGDCSLLVEVDGLRSDRGVVRALLFDGDEGFPVDPDGALASTRAPIEDGASRLCYPALPPGSYAVTLFHDENGNGRLDTNPIGWPREGFGASRGAHGRLGPPRYEDARFELEGGTRTEHVLVRYLPL